MRTILILNPIAGTSLLAETDHSEEAPEQAILRGLRNNGIESEVWYTTPEDAGDGLSKGHTPVSVIITPGALRVRVPTISAPGLHDEAEYVIEQESSFQ